MCGIAGVYNFGSNQPVDPVVLRRMCTSMSHRGPDGDGLHMDDANGLGLGHRRLSIIDLSLGAQPMATADEKLWITFNGEIYNFKELKQELVAAGHQFKTNCDTEVILYGYRQWGDEVLNRLNGMFVFALWDAPNRRLLIARDHAGVKPLYYRLTPGQIIFGSEVKVIEAYDDQTSDVDPAGLYAFMRLGYTPAPLTAFANINKLAPGTKLVVTARGATYSRWWLFHPKPITPPPTFEEAAEELLRRYSVAVKRNLISDVPVGLLLSGGLDSGLLLALMNQFGANWKTFTVGFGNEFADDELDDAARVAKALGSEHASVRITREHFEKHLAQVVGFLEEPVSTASIVPMFFVSERARQDVKVALIGQGPDELLAGYRRHRGVYYGKYWRSLPKPARDTMRGILDLLPGLPALRRASYSLDVPDRMRRYMNVLTLMEPAQLHQLFRPDVVPGDVESRLLNTWADLVPMMADIDELNGFEFFETRSILADQLLVYGDKLSMAHSLEVRVPYLDPEVIEFVECLPSSYKVRGMKGKALHRRVCQKFLPAEVLRRKKKGFAMNVVDDWFRSALTGRMPDLLNDPNALMYRFFDAKAAGRLLEEHKQGKRNHYRLLFSLVLIEEWLRSRAN